MALSAEEKKRALNTAINIIMKFGEGGNSNLNPDVALEKVYKKILELEEDTRNPQK